MNNDKYINEIEKLKNELINNFKNKSNHNIEQYLESKIVSIFKNTKKEDTRLCYINLSSILHPDKLQQKCPELYFFLQEKNLIALPQQILVRCKESIIDFDIAIDKLFSNHMTNVKSIINLGANLVKKIAQHSRYLPLIRWPINFLTIITGIGIAIPTVGIEVGLFMLNRVISTITHGVNFAINFVTNFEYEKLINNYKNQEYPKSKTQYINTLKFILLIQKDDYSIVEMTENEFINYLIKNKFKDIKNYENVKDEILKNIHVDILSDLKFKSQAILTSIVKPLPINNFFNLMLQLPIRSMRLFLGSLLLLSAAVTQFSHKAITSFMIASFAIGAALGLMMVAIFNTPLYLWNLTTVAINKFKESTKPSSNSFFKPKKEEEFESRNEFDSADNYEDGLANFNLD